MIILRDKEKLATIIEFKKVRKKGNYRRSSRQSIKTNIGKEIKSRTSASGYGNKKHTGNRYSFSMERAAGEG